MIVSTRDRPESLESCLRAVRDQRYPDLELRVVDSAPRRIDARSVAARFGADYRHLEQPGLSRARNYGARQSCGAIIVFLDDDLIVEPGCLDALADEFQDARTMAVTGRIILYGGDPEARAAFESFGGFDPGPDRKVVDRDTPNWFGLANFGGLGTGAMVAVRGSAFEHWSGFDERLGRGALLDGGEEVEAYFSLVRLGGRVVYTPRAVGQHPAPASMAELRRRVLNGASSASAYMTLLACECPRHRRDVLRYAWEAVRGQRREWRPRPATARHAVVPRWREKISWALGPLRYARMRLQAPSRVAAEPERRCQAD